MTRRRPLIAATLAIVLLGQPTWLRAADATPRETSWEDLMPKDWDPMKDLRGLDAGMVAEGSVKERSLMRQMREIWDNAPTNPKMDGTRVRLPGYVVPLEEVKGELKEFLLVPYFGACIHVPPPPPNQIVYVKLKKPFNLKSMADPYWVTGMMSTKPWTGDMADTDYVMTGDKVEVFEWKD